MNDRMQGGLCRSVGVPHSVLQMEPPPLRGLHFPFICADSLRRAGEAYYLLDSRSVRYFDTKTDSVSLIVGNSTLGTTEGVGSE